MMQHSPYSDVHGYREFELWFPGLFMLSDRLGARQSRWSTFSVIPQWRMRITSLLNLKSYSLMLIQTNLREIGTVTIVLTQMISSQQWPRNYFSRMTEMWSFRRKLPPEKRKVYTLIESSCQCDVNITKRVNFPQNISNHISVQFRLFRRV